MTLSSSARGLLILCSAWITVASPPVILGPSEMTHPAGKNFSLTCVGDKPLKWSWPESETTTFEEKVIESSPKSKSILEVSDSDYLATGEYGCSDGESTATVYIYVPDFDNLLAGKHTMLIGYQYHDVIIPCKPTAPEYTVKLTRENEVPEGSYDPKIGFTLRNVTIWDSGQFTCTASIDSREQTEEFVLIVNPYREIAPKPEIDVSTIQHVVIGQEIEITCRVRVEVGTMFIMDWIYPAMNSSDTERIVVENFTASEQSLHYYTWEKTLRIHSVDKKDEGDYTCTIKDHGNNTNSDSQYLKVYSKDESFINLTVHSRKIEVDATVGEIARWIVGLVAHPNAELIWYSPDGLKLSGNTPLNEKYDMKTKDFETSIEIYDVNINDAGNYTIVATNYREHKSLTLELVVYDVPIVKIEYHHYYRIGVSRNVTCRVIGYPTPKIQWMFQKCDFIVDERCEKYSFEPISRNSIITTEFQVNDTHLESKLEWDMMKPGLLMCSALNSKGLGNDTTVIRVTDVPQGFHIKELPSEITVGDNITLSCGVTSYEYKPNLSWYYDRDGSDTWQAIDNSTITIQSNRSYSHWSELNLKSINKSGSGLYKCVAEKNNKKLKKDEMVVRVNVLELEPPVIYETNLTNSEVTISSWQPLTWRCAARGVPEPTIIWYKNEEVLSLESNFSNFELLDNNQTLLVKSLTMNEEGTYICRVQNKGGTKEVFVSVKLKEYHKTNMTLIITIVVVALLLALLVLTFIFALWKIRKEKKLRLSGLQNFNKDMTEYLNNELTLDEQADLLPYDPKWEFPRSKLKLGKQLGSGAFGVVLKAEASGILENEEWTTVAVKMVKRQADSAYIRALVSELKILAHLGKHLNVVNLLGACTKNAHKGELLVIVEFCRFGNVHNYLLSHRDIFIDQIDYETGKIEVSKGRLVSDFNRSRINYATLTFPRSVNSDPNSALASFDTDTTCLSSLRSGGDETFSTSSNNNPEWCPNLKGDYLKHNVEVLSTSVLICWAFQIARGMEYLASRRVLHGDLAARNVLLADNNVVKICDFGFARSIYNKLEYRKSGDGPVPVKWMAIESVTHRIFSTQSDVWSFGIVLWELFSLARTPYPNFENFEIIHNKLNEGYRMEKPLYANQDLYDIMLECWDAQPCRRPSFSELVTKLGKLLENNVREHYVELNEIYSKYSVPEEEDYLSMVSPPTYDAFKSRYVNLPNEPSSPKSDASDYLDMNPWMATSNDNKEETIELKPMLSSKDSPEENDDYLIPRQVPSKSDCAFNPNYLVPQNKVPLGKKISTYGKLKKLNNENEVNKSEKKNIFHFDKNSKNTENKYKRTYKEPNETNVNLYANV